MLWHLFGKLRSISGEEVNTGKRSRQRQNSQQVISPLCPTPLPPSSGTRSAALCKIPFSWNLSGPGRLCYAILRNTTSQKSCPELTGFVPKACDLSTPGPPPKNSSKPSGKKENTKQKGEGLGVAPAWIQGTAGQDWANIASRVMSMCGNYISGF